MKTKKTNAMRILEEKNINYTAHEYESKGFMSGTEVAGKVGFANERVFKTLVTQGEKEYYVFILPSDAELSLKKAAKLAGEKNIHMINPNDLKKVTGYIKGGCSPVGMRKEYKTFIHDSALNQETILVSGGALGCQVEIEPKTLIENFDIQTEDIIQ